MFALTTSPRTARPRHFLPPTERHVNDEEILADEAPNGDRTAENGTTICGAGGAMAMVPLLASERRKERGRSCEFSEKVRSFASACLAMAFFGYIHLWDSREMDKK